MSELLNEMRKSFQDAEYRDSYAESFMNSQVAAQIKVLREDRDMTQQQLAEQIGTKQAGISRLENVNYSSWKVETLRKLARALHVRLRITFEEFGTLPSDMDAFNRNGLTRRTFEDDPVFNPAATRSEGTIARGAAAYGTDATSLLSSFTIPRADLTSALQAERRSPLSAMSMADCAKRSHA